MITMIEKTEEIEEIEETEEIEENVETEIESSHRITGQNKIMSINIEPINKRQKKNKQELKNQRIKGLTNNRQWPNKLISQDQTEIDFVHDKKQLVPNLYRYVY